jgi:hypothetical protein
MSRSQSVLRRTSTKPSFESAPERERQKRATRYNRYEDLAEVRESHNQDDALAILHQVHVDPHTSKTLGHARAEQPEYGPVHEISFDLSSSKCKVLQIPPEEDNPENAVCRIIEHFELGE